jgi:hypothetical protein
MSEGLSIRPAVASDWPAVLTLADLSVPWTWAMFRCAEIADGLLGR